MPARKNTWCFGFSLSLAHFNRFPLGIYQGFQSGSGLKSDASKLYSEKPLSMSNAKTKTGQTAKVSGQYRPLGTKSEITLSKGNRVPPYDGKAKTFILVDKTKHKG